MYKLGRRRRLSLARPLARSAPRLAVGLGLAAVIVWGFVPLVIRIYGSDGSLTGAFEPWVVAALSVLANCLVAAVVALALHRRGDPRPP